MTTPEQQAECLRICGPNVMPDTHSIAPEMCPIALMYWHNPKLKAAPVDRKKFTSHAVSERGN